MIKCLCKLPQKDTPTSNHPQKFKNATFLYLIIHKSWNMLYFYNIKILQHMHLKGTINLCVCVCVCVCICACVCTRTHSVALLGISPARYSDPYWLDHILTKDMHWSCYSQTTGIQTYNLSIPRTVSTPLGHPHRAEWLTWGWEVPCHSPPPALFLLGQCADPA